MSLGEQIVQFARGEIGKHPYVWGAKLGRGILLPGQPLDCSGFTEYCFRRLQIEIGPGTWHQRRLCIDKGQRVYPPYQAGDILFWMNEGPETASHVGISCGGGRVIEETASFEANVVEVAESPRWTQPFIEGYRILRG